MMKENLIQVICGPGKGKTASALGRGVTALLKGKTVIMVQFLKGSMETEGMEIVKRLEPEFKLFRFEKSPIFFDQLSEEEKDEARINIRNGLNFAKKVLVTVKDGPFLSESSNHSSRLRRWLCPVSFRKRRCADPRQESSYFRPYLHGSVYGRCNRYPGCTGR